MPDSLRYVDACTLGMSGDPFPDAPTPYQRLPVAAAGAGVPAKVVDLSEMSAGLYVDFVTASTEIHAQLELLPDPDHEHVGPPHGLDLYVLENHRWNYLGILKDLKRPRTENCIVRGLPKRARRYRLYLPYAGKVSALAIGVPETEKLEPAPAETRAPIFCYGTSIVHGFHASRPGMTMPSQLGRLLNYPVVNLGFSGNSQMQPELLPFFTQLKPAVFVIDCLPNMNPDLLKERVPGFVTKLRQAWPEVPLLLVENIVYQSTYALEDKRGGWGPKNDTLKQLHADLLKAGLQKLYYLTGEALLGSDGESTVDGTHPNDLGMKRLAVAYAAAIQPLLA